MGKYNKYYTPELHELRLGLEIEIKWNGQEPEWKKIRIQPGWLSELMYNYESFTHQIRVKYLDEEDILSLGWEKVNGIMFEIFLESEEHYYLMQHKTEVEINDYSAGNFRFYGHLKNKLELIEIMERIGILAERPSKQL